MFAEFDEREKVREIRLELDKTREEFEAELVKLLERAAALVTPSGFSLNVVFGPDRSL